jgi:hypothetical protein
LSKLFLLSKSNLGRHLLHSGTIRKIHVAMASTATATWLANGFNSRKKRMGWCWNRKKIGCQSQAHFGYLRVVRAIKNDSGAIL